MMGRRFKKFVVSVVFALFLTAGVSFMTCFFQENGVGTFDYAMSDEVQAENVGHGDNVNEKEDGLIQKIAGTYNYTEIAHYNSAEAAARIIIPKLSKESSAELEDEYINRKIRITVNNSQYAAYTKDMVLCDKDVVKEIGIKDVCPPGSDTVSTLITIELGSVYEYNLYEENNKYIIDMFDIHSVYDKVIVIDAGHGGGDNGCGSLDSRYYEKDVTLSIVKLLKERLDETDIKVYYTRLADETVYLKPRAALANAVRADMFISIHCNYYDRYPAYRISGAETLYSSVNKKMKILNRRLANIMIDEFTSATEKRYKQKERALYFKKEPCSVNNSGDGIFVECRRCKTFQKHKKKKKGC